MNPERPPAAKQSRTALVLSGVALAMLGLAFASVPLYRLFCQATGYNGTTQRVAAVPVSGNSSRHIAVRFDGNVAAGLPWSFAPVQRTLDVRLGEPALAFYRATNNADHAVTGSAVFNVVPEVVGIHFNKIQCFCFTEQTLGPHETADMAVSFYVDPALGRDPDLARVIEITLSYTFYESTPKQVVLKGTGSGGNGPGRAARQN